MIGSADSKEGFFGMFSRFYLKTSLLALALGGVFSVCAAQPAKDAPMGRFAAEQTRHIATYFPAAWRAARPNCSPPTT